MKFSLSWFLVGFLGCHLVLQACEAKAEPVKSYIVTNGEREPEAKTMPKVIEKERIIERERVTVEEAPKNQLRIIGGVMLQDLNDVETEKVENEEGEKQTNVNGFPDEDKLLYGFGYDRRFGIVSMGAAYMRNKPKTNQVVTINFGLNW